MADFEDGKDDSALRTIGEVSEALQIKPHVLRYWEQQFSLLNPLKRSGGRRYYRPEDIALVEAIDQLVNEEGYTLKGAEAVLRASGKAGLERRMGDRRSGERRVDAHKPQAAPTTAPLASPAGSPAAPTAEQAEGRDLSEIITGLKAIRARLASAIEA